MDIIKLYRIFALVGLFLIIYEMIFVKKRQKHTTYAMFPFRISSILWAFFTGCLIFLDYSDKNNVLNGLTLQKLLSSYSFLLFYFIPQVCLTFMLFLFSGKYAEYHIVYKPKKKRKPWTVDLEESYIVLYGLLKFKRKIYIRDIVIEDSYFIDEFKPSKLFPYAAIIATKEYMVAKLTNGKTIKINCSPFFILDETVALLELAKKMRIKIINDPKQIKEIK